jgi:hypothetical protein
LALAFLPWALARLTPSVIASVGAVLPPPLVPPPPPGAGAGAGAGAGPAIASSAAAL